MRPSGTHKKKQKETKRTKKKKIEKGEGTGQVGGAGRGRGEDRVSEGMRLLKGEGASILRKGIKWCLRRHWGTEESKIVQERGEGWQRALRMWRTDPTCSHTGQRCERHLTKEHRENDALSMSCNIAGAAAVDSARQVGGTP